MDNVKNHKNKSNKDFNRRGDSGGVDKVKNVFYEYPGKICSLGKAAGGVEESSPFAAKWFEVIWKFKVPKMALAQTKSLNNWIYFFPLMKWQF